MKIETIEAVRCGIGEGALWDQLEQRLYLVDILARQIVRYDPASGEVERFDVGQIIGSMALREQGGAVVGLASGVHTFDFEMQAAELLIDLEPDDRSLLLTEGKADPIGRFVLSSFSMAMTEPAGSFYSIAPGREARTLVRGVTVPNGLAWSPDGATMYYADSAQHLVYAADYDLDDGTLSSPRPFLETSALGGIPDGATTDADGNYWVAICQAGIVVCVNPRGEVTRTLEFPSKWVSSLAFGGPRLDCLYVTSLNPQLMNLGDDAMGGLLFEASDLDVVGMPSARTRF